MSLETRTLPGALLLSRGVVGRLPVLAVALGGGLIGLAARSKLVHRLIS